MVEQASLQHRPTSLWGDFSQRQEDDHRLQDDDKTHKTKQKVTVPITFAA